MAIGLINAKKNKNCQTSNRKTRKNIVGTSVKINDVEQTIETINGSWATLGELSQTNMFDPTPTI